MQKLGIRHTELQKLHLQLRSWLFCSCQTLFLSTRSSQLEVQAFNICQKDAPKENENGRTRTQPSNLSINPPCWYQKAYIRYSTAYEIQLFTQTVANYKQEKVLESDAVWASTDLKSARKRCESPCYYGAEFKVCYWSLMICTCQRVDVCKYRPEEGNMEISENAIKNSHGTPCGSIPENTISLRYDNYF